VRGEAIAVIGWDIGGVNVKASWLDETGGPSCRVRVTSRPFEIWHSRDRLPQVLREAFADVSGGATPRAMAVTMSAELSDVFATKPEGVLFVLECLRACFPDLGCYALDTSGDLVPYEEARRRPLDFAAANWAASALWVARKHPDCLLVDVGSTTTDILPIRDGKVRVRGRSDTARLISGELVYTGVLRTNLAAVVRRVPVGGHPCRVASETFAISADVHLILGHIRPQDYTCSTPDHRPPTIESARSRLARLVCADAAMMAVEDLDALARHIHRQQVQEIREGIEQVMAGMPELRGSPVIAHGAGAFLAREAALGLGLAAGGIQDGLSREESAALPALAVAHLLARHLRKGA